MKLTIKREPFLKSFSRVAIAADRRVNAGAMANVLLDASGEVASLYATNGEVAISDLLGADCLDVGQSGTMLLPAVVFKSMLSASTDDQLILSSRSGGFSLKGMATNHDIQTGKTESLPVVEIESASSSISVGTIFMRSAAKAIGVCCGASEYESTSSVLIECSESTLAIVGTEGHFLGCVEVAIERPAKIYSLVPQRSARAMADFIGSEDCEATLDVNESWLRLKTVNAAFMARLSSGRFFNWRSPFAGKNPSNSATVPVGVLKSAISQATVAYQHQDERRLTMTVGDGNLSVSSECAAGKSEISVPVSIQGKSFDVDVNFSYLTTILPAFPLDANVSISLADGGNPLFLSHGDMVFFVAPMTGKKRSK